MKKFKKFLSIIAALTLLTASTFTNDVVGRQNSGNICEPLGQCATVGSNVLIPDFPLPVFSCPLAGGTTICCTTCGPVIG